MIALGAGDREESAHQGIGWDGPVRFEPVGQVNVPLAAGARAITFRDLESAARLGRIG